MSKKLFVLLPIISLLFVGCANSSKKEESQAPSTDSSSIESQSEDSSESSSSEDIPQPFDVKFYVNTETFTTWDPVPTGYFIHVWNTSGGIDVWGHALMTEESPNLYTYTYTLEPGGSITGVVFAFNQGGQTKQTIDMPCNIVEAGSYLIQYDGGNWQEVSTDVWKMYGTIVPYAG